MGTEQKEGQVEDQSFEEQADAILDEFESGNSGDSSDAEEAEGKEGKEEAGKDDKSTDEAGVDQPKKASEEDDESESEIKGTEKDQLYRKAYNEAKAKAEKDYEEKLKDLASKEESERVKKLIESPAFIRAEMKEQGYTDSAINAKLTELGHSVPQESQGFVDDVLNDLNIKPDEVSDKRATIENIVDLARAAAERVFKERSKPLEQNLQSIQQKEAAVKVTSAMKTVLKEDGDILDFDTDIEPELGKYLDENPEATQQDVLSHFKDLNHRLMRERMKLGKKAKNLDVKKKNLRQNAGGGTSENDLVPKKTGDFETDADAILDAAGVY